MLKRDKSEEKKEAEKAKREAERIYNLKQGGTNHVSNRPYWR